jgi:hypothetical protein
MYRSNILRCRSTSSEDYSAYALNTPMISLKSSIEIVRCLKSFEPHIEQFTKNTEITSLEKQKRLKAITTINLMVLPEFLDFNIALKKIR